MPPKAASAPSPSSRSANAALPFEAKLWLAADKRRDNMDAAEYKHAVLGLIFLKYISDRFDEHHARLVGHCQFNSPARLVFYGGCHQPR